MTTGLLRAVCNLWRIPHGMTLAPPSRSALGNVTCKRSQSQGRRVEKSWILHNLLISQLGETEAAVTSETY